LRQRSHYLAGSRTSRYRLRVMGAGTSAEHDVPAAQAKIEADEPANIPPAARAALPALTVMSRSLALLAIEGSSVGLALWTFASSKRLLAYVTSNAISARGRSQAVLAMVVGALVAIGLGVAIVLRVRGAAGLEAVQRLARRCAPLALAA